MRIRLDGRDCLLAREARLALRVAGFIIVEGRSEADYVVCLDEGAPDGPVTIRGADGPFERLAINRLAETAPALVLERSPERNDRVLALSVPATDAMRRSTSRALVEIFLSYVSHPVVPRRDPQAPPASAIVQAQAQVLPAPPSGPDPTVDLLTQRLVDLTRLYVDTIEPQLRQVARAVDHVETLARAVTDVPTLLQHAQRDLTRVIADQVRDSEDRLTTSVTRATRPWWQRWSGRGE